MSGRLLTIDGLDTGYDGVAVVRGLSLHVDEGEVVALLGPNGAGKTTTLMTVSGMGQILAGSVTIMGRPVPRLRQAHRVARWGVIHVPENRGLLYQLTVRENLQLAKTSGRVDIDRAVDFFPALGPLMNRRGGAAQRRRAADAGSGSGHSGRAQADDGRRDEPGSGPGDLRGADAGGPPHRR